MLSVGTMVLIDLLWINEMNMKTLLKFGLLALLTNLLLDYLRTAENLTESPIEQTPSFDYFREDLICKASSIGPEAKLNVCVIEYMFKYPKEYERIKSLADQIQWSRLKESKHFQQICSDHSINLEDFEDNYVLK